MGSNFRLLCVLAHPDDESLGAGGTLAKYAAEGVETSLLMATRGERGWPGAKDEYPGPAALGEIREAELRAAASILGISGLHFLPYQDGALDQVDPDQAQSLISHHIRRIRPQVVITFGPEGVYGHPDHIAISQLTVGALVRAAGPQADDDLPPHGVSKLYFMAETEDALRTYEELSEDLVMEVDGRDRRSVGWPEWALTTRIDTSAYWNQVMEAIRCHQTQIPSFRELLEASELTLREIWGSQSYYRAYSLVNGGRGLESDLFAGFR